jgi:hypothetical protein
MPVRSKSCEPGSCELQQLHDTFWIDAVGCHQGFNDGIGERFGYAAREPGRRRRVDPVGRAIEGSFETFDLGFGLLEMHENLRPLPANGSALPR